MFLLANATKNKNVLLSFMPPKTKTRLCYYLFLHLQDIACNSLLLYKSLIKAFKVNLVNTVHCDHAEKNSDSNKKHAQLVPK